VAVVAVAAAQQLRRAYLRAHGVKWNLQRQIDY
jgi:hypothetical protein